MEVVFERTARRRYAIEIRRPDAPVMRMDPAPGFDDWFPHDLQHLIVEEQLGLTHGIYGRLANGGTASTFHPVRAGGSQNKRAAARQRRKLKKRDTTLASKEANDFAQSERATFVAWHDWMTHTEVDDLRAKAGTMAAGADAILGQMSSRERAAIVEALPRLRERIAAVTAQWSATEIGASMSITWSPVRRPDR